MRTRFFVMALLVVLAEFALAVVVRAQSLSAVTGTVTDQTGAVIPGVEITVTDPETGTERIVYTNGVGLYAVPQLQPGEYGLKAAFAGFKTALVTGLVLPVDETVSQDLQLEVGDATENVTVVAVTESLNTFDAKLGASFDARKIISLPLDARNIVGLLGLQAGVQLGVDNGGQVNGARPDQQNITLDGVNINRQEAGSAEVGALPTTVDSIQEFIVQTGGGDAASGRGSGGQVQLITRRGGNEIHGSLYEYYRTTGTNAANYFTPVASDGIRHPQQLIRHFPGFSASGPVVKDKLFIFATYEAHRDRSTSLVSRSVPTPEFLDGHVRYLRKDGSFGELTTGCGGQLEKWTLIPCDTWNSNLFGARGLYERYRPYSTDSAKTSPSDDGGANILTYRFNSPNSIKQGVYIARIDYNLNSKNSLYVRGTLNGSKSTLAGPFPGQPSSGDGLNNSKGFAANWNWSINPRINNNLTGGLTRESTETTGQRLSTWIPNGLSNSYVSGNPAIQAINTWNIVDNLSWIAGSHELQVGANVRFINNHNYSFDAVQLPTYTGPANRTANDVGSSTSPGLARALGNGEFSTLSNPQNVGDAVMAATGSVSQFSEDIQFDVNGNRLAAGSPFVRNFRLQEYEFYWQDNWKARPNLSIVYGLNYSVQTPPYETSGLEVNWMQDLQQRWKIQSNTTLTALQMPLYATQLAGRANRLPDYYPSDTNNWAPRISFAWSPNLGDGIVGRLARQGGKTVIRGGYSTLYDGFGRSFARTASEVGSIGLKTNFAIGSGAYSIDNLNDKPRAPRIGNNGWTGDGLNSVRNAFPVLPNAVSYQLPILAAGGWGAAITDGVDSNLHAAVSHLVTLTLSKELPSNWVIEASYVGRFSRGLVGVTDLASPVNVRDPKSGTTFYDAVKQLYTVDEFNKVAVENIQPIAWFENVYGAAKPIIEKQMGRTYNSVTQAFYAIMHKNRAPGPNTTASLIDTIASSVEGPGGFNILTQPQVAYFGMYTNLSKSNYNSLQIVSRKRLSKGFTATLNYTLGKSLDTTSAAESRGFQPGLYNGEGTSIDPYHPGLQYTRSDFDRRHQFNGNFSYALPVGKGQSFASGSSGLLNQLVSGWELSGIAVAASGRPFSFTANSRYNFTYFGRDLPQLVTPLDYHLTKITTAGKPDVYIIGTSAADRASIAVNDFVSTYPGGPVARNQGQGPSFFNIDAALKKSFDIREGLRARVQWEVFNALNHVNFALPGSLDIDQSIGNLGRIAGTANGERVMQFSFRLEF